MKYYTGVGSRSTPPHIMGVMGQFAEKMSSRGYILRSGGADGADTAFAAGSNDPDIYIPWEGFNGALDGIVVTDRNIIREAESIVRRVHPAPDRLSQGAFKLHTRNVYQVLGGGLDSPSEFLICWAPVDKEGVPKGGTRTAWVIAKEYGVRCYNLFNQDTLEKVEGWINNTPL